MTSYKGRTLLELKPHTIESVRKMYNLDDAKKMEEAIDILEKWVGLQNHFLEKTCQGSLSTVAANRMKDVELEAATVLDFINDKIPNTLMVSSRRYLELNIIDNKGSIEKAKSKLDKLFTLRTLFPKVFNYSDIRVHFKKFYSCMTMVPLPKLTDDHQRVISLTMTSNEYFFETPINYCYVMFSILFEHMKMYDYTNGCIVLLDFRNINIMDLIAKLNLIELKQFTMMLLDGYGLRLKAQHYLTPSKSLEMLLNIVKPFFGPKQRDRFYVHKDTDTIYEYIPKDILPVEYGGTERSLKELQEDWINLLSSEECTEFLNWTKKARVDESYRFNDKYDEYIGMAGTFRTMNVD